MKTDQHIIIIGGGLSGLTLAYLLHQNQIEVTLLEASSRLGGRIHTISGKNQTPLELGATWFSDIHIHVKNLVEELSIDYFKQHTAGKSLFHTKSFIPPHEFEVPQSDQPSYRFSGGTKTLIETLKNKMPSQNLVLNTKVAEIIEHENGLTICATNGKKYLGSHAIVCLPPQLVSECIRFTPDLPKQLQDVIPFVQTWMAGSIKFVIEYDTPFWKENNYSGMLYSHVGIVQEMYDHTNATNSKFGFTGFLNTGSGQWTHEERMKAVTDQFVELFGSQAKSPTFYEDQHWVNDLIVGNKIIHSHPHQYNGHPLFENDSIH